MSGVLRSTKYYFLQAMREKNMSFWVIIYPLLLMILMYIPLSGVAAGEQLDLSLGIAQDNPYVQYLQDIDFVDVKTMDTEAGEQAIRDKDIDVYITADGDVIARHPNESQVAIASGMMDQIKRMYALGSKAAKIKQLDHPLYTYENAPTNEVAIYFYNIVAMFALGGYYVSADYTSFFQANQISLAARNVVSPSSKWKGLAASILTSFLVILIAMIALLTLSEAILGLHLINHWGPSIVLLLAGMLFGIAWGLPFGAANIPYWSKTIIGIGGSLIMAMLSGMMGMDVRKFFQLNAPLVLKLNPVARLTEGFYRINVMNQTDEAYSALGILAVYAVIFVIIALLLFRKKSYKSL